MFVYFQHLFHTSASYRSRVIQCHPNVSFWPLFFCRVTKRRINSLQLKVRLAVAVKQKQSALSFANNKSAYASWSLYLPQSLRAKGGNGKWLLADDLGAEHSHDSHGDQSEGEKRGRRVGQRMMVVLRFIWCFNSFLTYQRTHQCNLYRICINAPFKTPV